MDRIKVLMLAGNCESTTFMYNGINDHYHIDKVIIEEPVSKKHLLKRRAKTIGFSKVLGQLAFIGYNVWLKKASKNRINEIKRSNNLDNKRIDQKIISKVRSINSPETVALLKKYRPDVVIVNGTRIISKEIIEAIDTLFINSHVGITPKYRGAHGGYWALTENDNQNCGVTVHLIDTGIDTGGVLYQDKIEVTHKDTFNTYPYLQIAAAIPLMRQAIPDVANKVHKIKKVNLISKLWSHPTILEYLKHRVFQGVK